MEKYRSTADPSTGVHPFLPPPPQPRTILGTVLAVPMLLLRLPLLLLSAELFLLLSPFVLLRPVQRLRDVLCGRLTLFALGVWRFRPPVLQRPRVRGVPAGRAPQKGDVVYCNWGGYLDVVFAVAVYSPVFVRGVEDGLEVVGWWPLFVEGMGGASAQGRRVPGGLAEVVRDAKGPVVVFAEGVRSNGKGVLKFVPEVCSLEGLPDGCAVFALGISYSAGKNEAYSIGGGVAHVLERMASLSSCIKGKVVAVPGEGADLQAAVATCAGVPSLSIGMEARLRFEEHWNETHCNHSGDQCGHANGSHQPASNTAAKKN